MSGPALAKPTPLIEVRSLQVKRGAPSPLRPICHVLVGNQGELKVYLNICMFHMCVYTHILYKEILNALHKTYSHQISLQYKWAKMQTEKEK